MKVKFYLVMAIAAFLMSNCSQDEPLVQTKNNTNTLTAFIENASRSSVTDGGVFKWNENDAIAVGNADGGYTKFVYGNETFTAGTSITPKGYAIYPFSDEYASLPETGLPTIKLAESYPYGSTNAPMLATIEEGATSLNFKHLAGLMRFRVKNVPATATDFTLTAEGMDITGEFTPIASNSETTIQAGTTGVNNEVKITFTEVKDVMTFYVPMPVGVYPSLKVAIGGKELSSATGVTNVITRGKLLLMPTMVYDETNGKITLEGGNNVSFNADEEVSLAVEGNEEVVVEIADGATATLNLMAPENSTLTISDGSDNNTESSTTSTGTLNVAVPNVSSLNINAPTLTVKLTSGTYDKVEALTAQQTLIIGEGVKIGELVLNGGNVKLEGDLELRTPLVIGIETTIDLNGHVIKPAGTSMNKTLNTKDALILVRKGGNLTITDSSKEGNGRIDTGDNSSIYGAIKMTDSADEATGDATLTIEAGSIKGYYYGIMGNGNGGNRNGTVITMTGGKIEEGYCSDDNTGIFHPQLGTLTISGGEITGYKSAVEMRSGTLNISNGTLVSTGTPAAAEANGNGNTITGAAIAVSQHTTNQELKAEISGGTFTGVYALYEEDKQDENVSNISMSVTGGTFNGKIFSENCKNFIKGGTFSNPSACNYLGEGANVTVELAENYEGAGFATASGQTVVLDLNNKTYTATDPLVGSTGTKSQAFQFLKGSNVTIKNGTLTSSQARMFVQNYTDLTLENVTLSPSIPAQTTSSYYYVLSNNGGDVKINNGTKIIAPKSATMQVYAMDVCNYHSSYPNLTVTVAEGAEIDGNIEYTGSANHKLVVNGGTFTGKFVVPENYQTIAKDGGISIFGGTFSDASAFEYLTDGASVKIGADMTIADYIEFRDINVTIDLNGKKIVHPANSSAQYKDVFEVYGNAELTIEGSGSVIAEDGYSVYAAGNSKVNLNGGYYFSPVSSVYASKNAVVTINGGEFYVDGTNNSDGDYGQKYTLNLKDNTAAQIIVKGGKFYKFDPANNEAEGVNTNFVADGYTSTQEDDYYVVSK